MREIQKQGEEDLPLNPVSTVHLLCAFFWIDADHAECFCFIFYFLFFKGLLLTLSESMMGMRA